MTYAKPLALACALSVALAGGAAAKPPLREVSKIDDQLFYIAVANEIRKQCNSISGRVFKAVGIMQDLRREANRMGYSDAEIRAYVKSDAEKARMRKKGESYLRANGVSYSKPNSFCTLGRAEIQKSSRIGVLLRAK